MRSTRWSLRQGFREYQHLRGKRSSNIKDDKEWSEYKEKDKSMHSQNLHFKKKNKVLNIREKV